MLVIHQGNLPDLDRLDELKKLKIELAEEDSFDNSAFDPPSLGGQWERRELDELLDALSPQLQKSPTQDFDASG